MTPQLEYSPTRRYDVAVIGAGVFGSWTALLLRRAGLSVVLTDQYGAGNSRSSSGGESRIIRMGYGADEIYTRSAARSMHRWLALAEEAQEPLFYRTGVLWLAHEEDPYPGECLQTLAKAGIEFARLNTTELGNQFPQLATTDISWALLEPESGALMARRAVQAVTRIASDEGVSYLRDTLSSAGFHEKFEFITTTSGLRIEAANYVFACGPWLPKLFPDLLAGRITPTRQEVLFFGPGGAGDNPGLYGPERLPIWIDFKNEAYGFPDLENRGVKVAIDRHGPPFDPDSDDRIITGEGLAEGRAYLARRLPAMRNAPVIESRVCQYENTSNGDFLIDQHPQHANVWLVGGGSGHGFKHGPSVGEYMVARIRGSREGIEPRFTLSRKLTTQERAVF